MKAVMGLEIHIHLLTKSKLFCSDSTDYEGKKPNENTCPVCLGFPGSKPKVNKRAIEFGIMTSKALNCKVNQEMFFSRKSYFYPDMPKNFQISQYEIPLAENGYLEISDKKIRIKRIHLEEDPGKLIHVGGDITTAKYVLIDYNRSGIPLLEIVTEPDFNSTKEIREFLSKLSSILEHIDEIIRQKHLKSVEMVVKRETRHFDAETKTTSTLRKKEFEEDYGYIFDPDLTKIEISREWITDVEKGMPELPDARIRKFIEKLYKNLQKTKRDSKVDCHRFAQMFKLEQHENKGIKSQAKDIHKIIEVNR